MKRAFTLVELLMTVLIMLILTTLLLPKIQTWFVRAEISKIRTDIFSIRNGLLAYYGDYNDYPPKDWWRLSCGKPIDYYSLLTTPVAYISSLPHSPWEDRPLPGESAFDRPWNNYHVDTCNILNPDNIGPGWVILYRGPIEWRIGYLSSSWYSVTNGIISRGGFYLNSNGRGNVYH